MTFIPSIGISGDLGNCSYDTSAKTQKISFQEFNFIDANGLLVFNKSRFTLRYDVDIGYTKTTDLMKFGDLDVSGYTFGFGLGAGYSFLNTKRITLALTGIIGMHYTDFGEHKTNIFISGINCSYKRKLNMFDVRLGYDFETALRFTNHFGMSAGLRMSALVGSLSYTYDAIENAGNDASKIYDVKGFEVTPRICVCWFM